LTAARAFEGVTPDLDRHCARVNASASALGLTPTMAWRKSSS
jgi:branched-chain amino acid aminotransferase